MDFVLVIAILHKIMYGMYEKRIRGKNRSIFFSLFLISCMCCVFPLLYLLSNTKKSLYQTSRDNHNNNNIILQGLHQCWNFPPPQKKKTNKHEGLCGFITQYFWFIFCSYSMVISLDNSSMSTWKLSKPTYLVHVYLFRHTYRYVRIYVHNHNYEIAKNIWFFQKTH